MKKLLSCCAVALSLLVFPSLANADVLIEEPGPRTISCGENLDFAVWYQSYSGGPRWAVLQVRNMRGVTVASKRVTATSTWKHYTYSPACGRSYDMVYRLPGAIAKFRIRVRS